MGRRGASEWRRVVLLMICRNEPCKEDIRATDPHRHKYDNAMAEYLDFIGADYEDESTGSVEWCEYVQRFGKRLLITDDRGFVTCDKYATEDAAREVFGRADVAYGEWLDAEDQAQSDGASDG